MPEPLPVLEKANLDEKYDSKEGTFIKLELHILLERCVLRGLRIFKRLKEGNLSLAILPGF